MSMINGMLSALIVIVCLMKKYSIFSIAEHVLFIILLLHGHHQTASFCFCMSVKVVVSLGFFIWETNGANEMLSILRYLMGSWNHALVLAGETVCHHAQEPGMGNDDKSSSRVVDRIFNLYGHITTKHVSLFVHWF